MKTNVISPEDIARGVIDGVLPVYKERGETPLECLERVRASMPSLQGRIGDASGAYAPVKMSYAGRLDPLAEGLMLLLVGNTNNEREKYLSLDKVYELDVLFGIGTDTGDLLGIVEKVVGENGKGGDFINMENMENEVQKLVGKLQLPYPAYSSKTVNGKALFQYAREGKLGEIEIPTTDTEIYSTEVLGWSEVSSTDVLEKVRESVALVKGDFRQEEILKSWQMRDGENSSEDIAEGVAKNSAEKFKILKLRIKCSSGTYMRTLAEYLGNKAGMPALAWHIKRVEVGEVKDIKSLS